MNKRWAQESQQLAFKKTAHKWLRQICGEWKVSLICSRLLVISPLWHQSTDPTTASIPGLTNSMLPSKLFSLPTWEIFCLHQYYKKNLYLQFLFSFPFASLGLLLFHVFFCATIHVFITKGKHKANSPQ